MGDRIGTHCSTQPEFSHDFNRIPYEKNRKILAWRSFELIKAEEDACDQTDLGKHISYVSFYTMNDRIMLYNFMSCYSILLHYFIC